MDWAKSVRSHLEKSLLQLRVRLYLDHRTRKDMAVERPKGHGAFELCLYACSKSL